MEKQLLSLILNKKVVNTSTIGYRDNHIRVFYSIGSKDINIDTLCRLTKEWIIKDTNDVLNTFNSSSVRGWAATSLIYNKQFTGETEFKAVSKLAKFIVKERKIKQ